MVEDCKLDRLYSNPRDGLLNWYRREDATDAPLVMVPAPFTPPWSAPSKCCKRQWRQLQSRVTRLFLKPPTG